MSEFDLIRRHLAPLAANAPGAFELTDDAALIDSAADVIAADALVAGVHFLETDPYDLVARKALRVNLSDLAAMGAKPVAYLLTCVWPKGAGAAAVQSFCEGLEADQAAYKVSLIGGDTTAHRIAQGPFTVSLTMLGVSPKGGVLRRNGAAIGDDVYVTGSIGDAGLGLAAVRDESLLDAKQINAVHREYLIGRYRLPEPRLSFGGALAGLASAVIDVSDGLLADAGHIASESDVSMQLSLDRLPVSGAAADWVRAASDERAAAALLTTFGDDYELLFTAAPTRRRAVEMAGRATKTPVTKIGVVAKGEGVAVVDADGAPVSTDRQGFDHFSG
ncbi:MAG: thiamine-phosphate kinase [Pseudomonadota bacterium]